MLNFEKMNGHQLMHIINFDPYMRKRWKGFAALDTPGCMGVGTSLPAFYLLNTDKESGDGKHWCVAYIEDRKKMEFFDSFGFPPELYGLERLFPAGEIVYNPRMVQNLEAVTCGAHCLFFAYLRSRGYSMRKVLNVYDEQDCARNDEMVSNFVQQFGTRFKPRKK